MELQGHVVAEPRNDAERQLLTAEHQAEVSASLRETSPRSGARCRVIEALKISLGLCVVLVCGAAGWSAMGALTKDGISNGIAGGAQLPAQPRELPAVVPKPRPAASAQPDHQHHLMNRTQPKRNSRLASFLVIGDWGYDPFAHGNVAGVTLQQTIANSMLAKMEELGDVKFVVNVGDSFYPDGVSSKSDPQWQKKWRNIYDKKLRSVPWYSVYGNHDYHHDPCSCSEDPMQCAQVNANKSNLDYFYMPDVSYYLPHPELDMEVIGLDLNTYVMGWNQAVKKHELEDCQYSPCPAKCKRNAQKRAMEAFDLFHTRRQQSTAKNLLVFSHYPTDYFHTAPHFMKGLSDPAKQIVYFGGHRHSVDQSTTASISPNVNWLVGGGGGWSCDTGKQGFVVGEISESFDVHTYSVLVPTNKCCKWR